MVGEHAAEHGLATAAGEVDVEQDDIGEALVDELDGGVHLVRLADDLDGVAELGPHAGPEDRMVLDQEDPRAAALDSGRSSCGARRGGLRVGAGMAILSSTSVPSPGADRMTTVPP